MPELGVLNFSTQVFSHTNPPPPLQQNELQSFPGTGTETRTRIPKRPRHFNNTQHKDKIRRGCLTPAVSARGQNQKWLLKIVDCESISPTRSGHITLAIQGPWSGEINHGSKSGPQGAGALIFPLQFHMFLMTNVLEGVRREGSGGSESGRRGCGRRGGGGGRSWEAGVQEAGVGRRGPRDWDCD